MHLTGEENGWHTQYSHYNQALGIGVYGYFLLLPTVLGILGAMIFFTEKDNLTEKNINTIPIDSDINFVQNKCTDFFCGFLFFSDEYCYDYWRDDNRGY